MNHEMIHKHLISINRTNFGQPNSDYDFSLKDPEKELEDLNRLKSDQVYDLLFWNFLSKALVLGKSQSKDQ